MPIVPALRFERLVNVAHPDRFPFRGENHAAGDFAQIPEAKG